MLPVTAPPNVSVDAPPVAAVARLIVLAAVPVLAILSVVAAPPTLSVVALVLNRVAVVLVVVRSPSLTATSPLNVPLTAPISLTLILPDPSRRTSLFAVAEVSASLVT